MSKIRSKGTKLDLAMKQALEREELEFSAYPKIFGSPDFLVGDRIVVFCDSSFWHGRDWKKLKAQLARGNNPDYWISHIEKNMRRDKHVTRHLKSMGYEVVRFWDQEIYKDPEKCIRMIRQLAKA